MYMYSYLTDTCSSRGSCIVADMRMGPRFVVSTNANKKRGNKPLDSQINLFAAHESRNFSVAKGVEELLHTKSLTRNYSYLP